MSNPAVITLAETKTSVGNFRIEDNIGEAIHLHLGDIRIDLTIKEFRILANDINAVVKRYFETVPGFDLETISKEFFLQQSECWSDLKCVKCEKIKLSSLIVDTESFGGFVKYKTLRNSRVLKALNGNSKENDRRIETNYYGKTNNDRVEDMLRIIKAEGYNIQKGSIVLFNDKNNIIDGQHRAACMYHLFGDMEVPIKRFYFNDNKHTVTSHPVIERLFVWNKERIIDFMRKTYRWIRRVMKCLKLKTVGLAVRFDRIKYANRRG